jgi:hypothetical protein
MKSDGRYDSGWKLEFASADSERELIGAPCIIAYIQ